MGNLNRALRRRNGVTKNTTTGIEAGIVEALTCGIIIVSRYYGKLRARGGREQRFFELALELLADPELQASIPEYAGIKQSIIAAINSKPGKSGAQA